MRFAKSLLLKYGKAYVERNVELDSPESLWVQGCLQLLTWDELECRE